MIIQSTMKMRECSNIIKGQKGDTVAREYNEKEEVSFASLRQEKPLWYGIRS